jgi:hypothetical protein
MKTRITPALMPWLLLTLACVCSSAQVKSSDRVVEVPFDFYRNEIILQVKVNGKGPFNMMLDTGTDPSVIDLATAKQLGVELIPLGTPATGGGTDVNLPYGTELPLVDVGGLTVKNIEALCINLSKVGERLGKPLHGVLGHSLLNGRIVQIDYPKRVVRFYSASPFSKATNQSNTSTRTVLPFRYAENVLIDDVSVNGKKVVANRHRLEWKFQSHAGRGFLPRTRRGSEPRESHHGRWLQRSIGEQGREGRQRNDRRNIR